MIDHKTNVLLCSPPYKQHLKPCRYAAVSSPNGTKRQLLAGPLPRRVFGSHGDSAPLPGLSSMLHYQRSSREGNQVVPIHGGDNVASHAAYPTLEQPTATSDHVVPLHETSATGLGTRKRCAPVPKKSSRYLREMDRRAILARIEEGEKQSVLAKEYQVSRAAICNLNKHRDEVLSRKDGNPWAKHPKKPRTKMMTTTAGGNTTWARVREPDAGPETPQRLYEIKSRAVALLLTTLRKKHATVHEFRRASDRLMRLVMEEAMAQVPVKTVKSLLPTHSTWGGVALEHPPCAVSMEPAGCPMLHLFRMMEPDQPTGSMRFGTLSDSQATICGSKLPSNLNYHNVFLMDQVVTSADAVVAVVRRLQERGAVEAMISLVALIATTDAVEKVHAVFPALKIVVAQVEQLDRDELHPPYIGCVHADPTWMRVAATDLMLDRFEQVYHSRSFTQVERALDFELM